MQEEFKGLELWRRTMLELVRKNDETDLSARQTAVLLNVYLTPKPHTVRRLSSELNISKPAVTRAIDRLSTLGFIIRKTNAKDRRSVDLSRTVKGAAYVRLLGDIIAKNSATNDLPPLMTETKESN